MVPDLDRLNIVYVRLLAGCGKIRSSLGKNLCFDISESVTRDISVKSDNTVLEIHHIAGILVIVMHTAVKRIKKNKHRPSGFF